MTTDLVKVITVYNDVRYVSRDDLAKYRTQIPLRFSTGLKYSDSPIKKSCTTIHRDNIKEVQGV
jgi:hypothetical protein